MPSPQDGSAQPGPIVESEGTHGWVCVASLEDIPRLGARVLRWRESYDIALFRNADDRVFAVRDRCPHKGGALSQGIVSGDRVSCPLHGLSICLADGRAIEPDEGCVPTYAVKIEEGSVYLQLKGARR